MNKQKIVIITLSVALFTLAQYVIYEKIMESRQQEIIDSFQKGYSKGLIDAVNTLYRQTENCQPAKIMVGNLTKYVVDITCFTNETNSTR